MGRSPVRSQRSWRIESRLDWTWGSTSMRSADRSTAVYRSRRGSVARSTSRTGCWETSAWQRTDVHGVNFPHLTFLRCAAAAFVLVGHGRDERRSVSPPSPPPSLLSSRFAAPVPKASVHSISAPQTAPDLALDPHVDPETSPTPPLSPPRRFSPRPPSSAAVDSAPPLASAPLATHLACFVSVPRETPGSPAPTGLAPMPFRNCPKML